MWLCVRQLFLTSCAIYGLKRTAMEGEKEFGTAARQFVVRHFYMDNGSKSFSKAMKAVDVLKKAQEMLPQSNLRLHKIASNNAEVMRTFPGGSLQLMAVNGMHLSLKRNWRNG
ncbi:hypothetical protein KUCAC02_028802 [Chaenocephalus aceratus]|uniref:Uncharacterized protein n=1 Tax=Chaenocephalus aceratus TaxID=36190 RepID=A0ACB9X4P4_CHAAC|nr:hypothetical protein KUCAC02_028802 [Chaenocephalus aceratus]